MFILRIRQSFFIYLFISFFFFFSYLFIFLFMVWQRKTLMLMRHIHTCMHTFMRLFSEIYNKIKGYGVEQNTIKSILCN